MITAGIDEAGRGPGAGPVIAAAVIFPPDFQKICPDDIKEKIFDSKKVSKKNREKVSIWIQKNCDYGIGESTAEEVDTYGIKKATHMAMEQAVKNLSITPEFLKIDGNDNFFFAIKNECIIKGDEKIQEISAASIIAKVYRDSLMNQYAKKFPQYGFENHKGYLTGEHIQAIKKFGVCPIHRTSYEPIPKILYQTSLF